MKFFVLALLSLSLNSFAQTSYTQSAPISISADGLAGEVGEDEETMRARSELAASKVKATDEKKERKAEEKKEKEIKVEKLPEETKLVETEPESTPKTKKSKIDWAFDWKERQRTLFFKFGLLNSNWNKVSSELEKGSTVLGLGLNQSLSNSFSLGVSLDFHHFKEGSLVPEEIRILGLRIEPQFLHVLNANFSLIGAFALTLADSNIRKKIQASNTTETYKVFSSGTVFSFSPGVGIRGHFSQHVYFDLISEYQYFVGKPQKYYGGLGGSVRLHLSI